MTAPEFANNTEAAEIAKLTHDVGNVSAIFKFVDIVFGEVNRWWVPSAPAGDRQPVAAVDV